MSSCRACRAVAYSEFIGQERMFGLGDRFKEIFI